jgi:DNA-binding response OmpR family regulator
MPKPKVLIIDDEQEFASTLKERLIFRDYDTQAVFRAEDALSSITEEHPEVVLLDLGLEGVCGMDMLRAIRSSGTDCAVLVLTGVADEHVFREAGEAGAADILVKPIDIDILVERINRAYAETDRRRTHFPTRRTDGSRE